MRFSLSFILILVAPIFISAQDQPRIGVPLFDFKEDNNLNLSNHVTEVVIALLQKSGRFTVVDMTSEKQRQSALDRAQENYKSENWIDANSALNAEVILAGEITSIKFVKSNSPGQPGYRAAITMTLKLVDVESSKVLASDHFRSEKSELRLTPETALSSAIESFEGHIQQFFIDHVKQSFSILKINSIQKGKAVKVTVQIPRNLNIRKGDVFKMVHQEKLGNQIVPNLIGELRVKKHISDDFWLMEVRKGGDALFGLRNQLNEIKCSE